MRVRVFPYLLSALALGVGALRAQPTPMPTPGPVPVTADATALALLEAAGARLRGLKAFSVDTTDFPPGDFEQAPFQRIKVVTVKRPNLFRVDFVKEGKTERLVPETMCDGERVWSVDRGDYIAYQKPYRAANFDLGIHPIVQYFFSGTFGFDSTDPFWGNSVSLYDTNKDAYNKFVTIRYLGEKEVVGVPMKLVRMRFNSPTEQMQRVFYFKDDWLMMVIVTWSGGLIQTTKYDDYQVNLPLDAGFFTFVAPPRFPIQETDPVRLGEKAPDFELPLEAGGTAKLQDLLRGKRGLLISVLDGTRGFGPAGPDAYLRLMRIIQSVRDKYSSQGLEVVAVVGGSYVTPDVTTEMMRNWMPDTSRFSYPVAIDVDLERGIQGTAYQNFRLGGRNNVLLDGEGKVVFACTDFDAKRVNELALYQALAQLGFSISAAELDGMAR
jgi:outer membrane lipoprotein-sorting protein